MSFATQSAKRHAFGRSHLSLAEARNHFPWYASARWQTRKDAIARRVAKRVERAVLRRLEREDLANGITPEMAKARTVERAKELHPEKLPLLERIYRFISRIWKTMRY